MPPPRGGGGPPAHSTKSAIHYYFADMDVLIDQGHDRAPWPPSKQQLRAAGRGPADEGPARPAFLGHRRPPTLGVFPLNAPSVTQPCGSKYWDPDAFSQTNTPRDAVRHTLHGRIAALFARTPPRPARRARPKAQGPGPKPCSSISWVPLGRPIHRSGPPGPSTVFARAISAVCRARRQVEPAPFLIPDMIGTSARSTNRPKSSAAIHLELPTCSFFGFLVLS